MAYSKLTRGLNNDPQFNGMASTEKLLYYSLYGNSACNTAGIFCVRPAILADEMSVNDVSNVKKLLCKENPFWIYDEKTNQVFIRDYFDNNSPAGDTIINAAKIVSQMSASPIIIIWAHSFFTTVETAKDKCFNDAFLNKLIESLKLIDDETKEAIYIKDFLEAKTSLGLGETEAF